MRNGSAMPAVVDGSDPLLTSSQAKLNSGNRYEARKLPAPAPSDRAPTGGRVGASRAAQRGCRGSAHPHIMQSQAHELEPDRRIEAIRVVSPHIPADPFD